jgi:glucose/arabinose dehydrogenase
MKNLLSPLRVDTLHLALLVAMLPGPAAAGWAQQDVPFRGNIPVAPSGIPIPALPEVPVEYQTAEGQDIRVRVYARGLSRPWSLAFLPGGRMLVTERGGQLRLVGDGVVDPEPVAGVPEVRAQGLGGLMTQF